MTYQPSKASEKKKKTPQKKKKETPQKETPRKKKQNLDAGKSKNNAPHGELFWSNGPNQAVRLGNWKLLIVGDHKFLFNLESDLGEKNNLVEQEPEVVRKLEKALKKWREQMKSPAWPSKPNRRKVDVDGVPYELNI